MAILGKCTYPPFGNWIISQEVAISRQFRLSGVLLQTLRSAAEVVLDLLQGPPFGLRQEEVKEHYT